MELKSPHSRLVGLSKETAKITKTFIVQRRSVVYLFFAVIFFFAVTLGRCYGRGLGNFNST